MILSRGVWTSSSGGCKYLNMPNHALRGSLRLIRYPNRRPNHLPQTRRRRRRPHAIARIPIPTAMTF